MIKTRVAVQDFGYFWVVDKFSNIFLPNISGTDPISVAINRIHVWTKANHPNFTKISDFPDFYTHFFSRFCSLGHRHSHSLAVNAWPSVKRIGVSFCLRKIFFITVRYSWGFLNQIKSAQQFNIFHNCPSYGPASPVMFHYTKISMWKNKKIDCWNQSTGNWYIEFGFGFTFSLTLLVSKWRYLGDREGVSNINLELVNSEIILV